VARAVRAVTFIVRAVAVAVSLALATVRIAGLRMVLLLPQSRSVVVPMTRRGAMWMRMFVAGRLGSLVRLRGLRRFGLLGLLLFLGRLQRFRAMGRRRRLRRLRCLWGLSGCSRRRRRHGKRRGRSDGLGDRRRLRCRRRLAARGDLRGSRARLARRRVDTSGRRRACGSRRRHVSRRCGRLVMRPVAGRWRRDDDLLRGRQRAGTSPNRRQMGRARVEKQGHSGRADQERDQRHHRPTSDYPDSARAAFVGRHRPLPFPTLPSPTLRHEYKKPGRTSTRLRRRDSLFAGNH
jgi:hypothetical protein